MKLRKRLNINKKLSKSVLHRFIHAYFGKTYKIRKKPSQKDEHHIKRKKFAEYIKEENIKEHRRKIIPNGFYPK